VAKSKAPKKTSGKKSTKASAKPAKGKPKANGTPKAKTKKPAAKPVKLEQQNLQLLTPIGTPIDAPTLTTPAAPIARPRITSPLANAEVDETQNLTVTGVVNLGNVRYRLEVLLDGNVVTSQDATPDDGGTVQFTIPAGTLQDGKIYEFRLMVHPDDAGDDGHLDHTITLTTATAQTTPPIVEE
jgi:hypothetical protein